MNAHLCFPNVLLRRGHSPVHGSQWRATVTLQGRRVAEWFASRSEALEWVEAVL